LARKTVLVCDNCGKEIAEGKGAMMRLNFTDARRGSKQADLCDNCAGQMPGHAAARRGRRPKSDLIRKGAAKTAPFGRSKAVGLHPEAPLAVPFSGRAGFARASV
jgi:ribosomal protein S26